MRDFRESITSSKIAAWSSKPTNLLKGFSTSIRQKIPSRRWLILAILLIVIVVGAVFVVKSRKSQQTATAGDMQTYVAKGSSVDVNKKFNVPIKNADGKTTGADLVVSVTNLERSNQVVYNGRPLTARESKDFVVVNLEVENSTNNRLTVRPVDFFRIVGKDGKNYAADLQTDPVTVEPVSNRRARTIFIVDQNQRTLKILIGDVRGSQEAVEVTI